MTDAELIELQRRAQHTDLWDDADRDELFDTINAARTLRGLNPLRFEPPAWYRERRNGQMS